MLIRVEKEVSVMQMVNSTQKTVHFYGYVQWNNAIGLVMKYFPGGNLCRLLLNNEVKLGGFLRLRMCSEIAEGVSLIHNLPEFSASNKKVIHGDLKAENVLITEDFHCRIGDFGSANLVTCSGHSTILTLTQSDSDFTPCYAAPELLKKPDLKPNPAIDTYSFSMIIYLILKRKYPFLPSTREIYLNNVKKGELPKPSCDGSLENECKNYSHSREVVDLLKRKMGQCQQFTPSKRPAMQEVAASLKKGLTSRHHAVSKDVQSASKNFIIHQPEQHKYTCQSIDKFLPPRFQSTLG